MKLFLKRRVNSVDFFFCFLTNTIFVKKGAVWAKCELRSTVFIGAMSLIPGANFFLFKFLTNSVEFWNLFWKIIAINRNSNFGFFSELELVGLGFRIKKITSSLYRFFWGHSNYVYLFVPATVLVEYSQEERLVFFFSLDLAAINSLTSYLLLLKKLSVYRVTGFLRPGKIIRLNSGKQR